LKYDSKKPTCDTAEQNYPGSVTSYDTRPLNKITQHYSIMLPPRYAAYMKAIV